MKLKLTRNIELILIAIIIGIAIIGINLFVASSKLSEIECNCTDERITGQNEGVLWSVNTILTQIQEQGFATITIGDQVVVLVPYKPA